VRRLKENRGRYINNVKHLPNKGNSFLMKENQYDLRQRVVLSAELDPPAHAGGTDKKSSFLKNPQKRCKFLRFFCIYS
jgi:hypothetical protein